MAGVGVRNHADGFTGKVAENLAERLNVNIQWKVYARSGYTVNEISRKLVPTINEQEVHLIFLGVGANDAFQLRSPSRWIGELNQCLTLLRTKYPRAMIVCLNLPPIKDFPAFTPLMRGIMGNLIQWYGEALNDSKLHPSQVYVLNKPIFINESNQRYSRKEIKAFGFFSDGVHPSEKAYCLWASATCDQLFERKEIRMKLQELVNN